MYADLEDVQTLRLKRDKLELERSLLFMKDKEAREKVRQMKAQTAFTIAKCEKARFELKKMEDLLRTLKRGDKLDAQTLNQIREVYGFIKQPYIAKNPEATQA
jgi:hypothetical protein